MDEKNPPDGSGDGPHVDWRQVRDVHRLQRPADRMVAGVCSGLGRHFGVDPLVLRVAFGVLAFFGGAGILLYGALWLLLPDDGQERAAVHLDESTRGLVLTGVAVLAALALVGDSWGLYWFPWPLALVALVGWVLYNRSQDGDRRPTPDATPGSTPPPGAPSYGWQPGPHGQVYAPYDPGPPPPAPVRPPTPRPRDPRRRGPLLFWPTLALVVLAMGVLGTVEVAGATVAPSAYPALATTICAVMLLVGAFWGRAGGITALALLAALATAGTVTAERWDHDATRVVATPTNAAELRDHYEVRRGEVRLDLTDVDDLAALDGRAIRLEGGAGRILLDLPADLAVDLVAEVGGPGSIRLPDGRDRGGIALSVDSSFGPSDAPRVEVTAELGVGEIEVRQS